MTHAHAAVVKSTNNVTEKNKYESIFNVGNAGSNLPSGRKDTRDEHHRARQCTLTHEHVYIQE